MGCVLPFFLTMMVFLCQHLAYVRILKFAESQSALIDHDRSSLYCYRPLEGASREGLYRCLPQRLDHQASGSRWPLALCQVARAARERLGMSPFLEGEVRQCRSR